MASRRFTVILLALTVSAAAVSGWQFTGVRAKQPVMRGPGVTRVVPLSRYFAGLAGTPGDTDVYVLESGKPGGTLLVMGGVHANEPAGMIAAVLVVENARVSAGRVFVIPQANASAATHTESSEGFPTQFSIADRFRPDPLVPFRRPADESGSPVARPGGLHALPERAAAVGLRRPQSRSRVSRSARWRAHREDRLRHHGAGAARVGRPDRGLPRGAADEPDRELRHLPRARAGTGHDGVDRSRDERDEAPARAVAEEPARHEPSRAGRPHEDDGAAGRDGEPDHGPAARPDERAADPGRQGRVLPPRGAQRPALRALRGRGTCRWRSGPAGT